MPFACTVHHEFGSTEDNVPCPVTDKSKCDIVRCEMVHFMHAEGTGRLAATGQQNMVGKDADGNDQMKVESINLHLCCDSTKQDALKTNVGTAVSCPKCRDFIKTLEAKAISQE